MTARRSSWDTPCLLSATLLLASCVSAPPLLPSQAPVTPPGPPGFSLAIKRGLPLTVGVYGVSTAEPEEARAGSPRPRAAFAGARLPARGPGPAMPRIPGDDEQNDDSVNIGAGFIIDAEGTIATAAHVVADSSRIVVKLTDRRVFEAELVGTDVETDIALIRVPIALPVAPVMGQSTTLQSGDWVVAIGDPYGLNRSVAAGIVGGGARHFAEDREALFIQSDLALNPGNSGGPLLDASGSIVGMNLRMMVGPFGTAGVSLSMPIEQVLKIADDLKDGSMSVRPRLGATFEDVSPPAALAAGRLLADGAVVTAVTRGSVADRLGLAVDDIVVGFNGRALSDSADMVKSLLDWDAEEGTRLTVYRNGDYLELALD